MSTLRVYLVIRADRKVRIVKRLRLYADEVAVPITLTFPDHWGRAIYPGLAVEVPDFTPEAALEQTDD